MFNRHAGLGVDDVQGGETKGCHPAPRKGTDLETGTLRGPEGVRILHLPSQNSSKMLFFVKWGGVFTTEYLLHFPQAGLIKTLSPQQKQRQGDSLRPSHLP